MTPSGSRFMQELARRRCYYHSGREAAARCPECGEYFCRECVTEHEDRVLCTRCLQQMLTAAPASHRAWGGLLRLLGCVVSVTFLWLVFYGIGQMLLALPGTFHDGFVGQQQEERP